MQDLFQPNLCTVQEEEEEQQQQQQQQTSLRFTRLRLKGNLLHAMVIF